MATETGIHTTWTFAYTIISVRIWCLLEIEVWFHIDRRDVPCEINNAKKYRNTKKTKKTYLALRHQSDGQNVMVFVLAEVAKSADCGLHEGQAISDRDFFQLLDVFRLHLHTLSVEQKSFTSSSACVLHFDAGPTFDGAGPGETLCWLKIFIACNMVEQSSQRSPQPSTR